MLKRRIAVCLLLVAVIAQSGPGYSRSNKSEANHHKNRSAKAVAIAPLRMSIPLYQFPRLTSEEQGDLHAGIEPQDGRWEPSPAPTGFIGWGVWWDKLRNDPAAICTLLAAAAVWLVGFVRYKDILDNHYIAGFCQAFDLIGGRFVSRGDSQYNYTHRESPDEIPPLIPRSLKIKKPKVTKPI